MLAIPHNIPIIDIEYLFAINREVIEQEAQLATLATKPTTRKQLLDTYDETFDQMMSEVIASYYKGELDD